MPFVISCGLSLTHLHHEKMSPNSGVVLSDTGVNGLTFLLLHSRCIFRMLKMVKRIYLRNYPPPHFVSAAKAIGGGGGGATRIR